MPLHLNKPALRVLGIAESFERPCALSSDPVSTTLSPPMSSWSMLAGVVMRADRRVDGLAYARASVGGDDATRAVLEICRRLDRRDINALFLSGAAISWFNIIDLVAVFEEVSRPLICLTYEEYRKKRSSATVPWACGRRSGSRRATSYSCACTGQRWKRREFS